jgi:hypothetical protein
MNSMYHWRKQPLSVPRPHDKRSERWVIFRRNDNRWVAAYQERNSLLHNWFSIAYWNYSTPEQAWRLAELYMSDAEKPSTGTLTDLDGYRLAKRSE